MDGGNADSEVRFQELGHELTDKLSAMVLDAAACVYWLKQPEPNTAQALLAAARLSDCSHRAADILAEMLNSNARMAGGDDA
jgi:hypothetical protein